MKIAWFTPFSARNAIGHYSAEIYGELSKHADVTIFASDVTSAAETWIPHADIVFVRNLGMERTLARLGEYDICIYNLGDHFGNHGDIYLTAMQTPGISIIHDLVMNHFFSGLYFVRLNSPDGYVRELLYSHGEKGKHFGEDIVSGRAKGDGIDNVWMSAGMLEFNMAKSALRNTLGAIAHSHFACEAIAQFASFPTRHINFPVFVNPLPVNTSIPKSENTVRLLTFGNLNANKAVHLTLEAIAKSPLLREKTTYDLIGDLPDWYKVQLEPLIHRYDLSDKVTFHGFTSDETLSDHIAAADVIINLRNPHFGESSASLMQSMYYGKPTVVWKHGYYDEFPDDTVEKVNSVAGLQAALERLVSDELHRQQLGQNARKHAHETFNTSRYCDELLRFIDEILLAKPLYSLIDLSYKMLSEMGADQRDADLFRLITSEVAAFG